MVRKGSVFMLATALTVVMAACGGGGASSPETEGGAPAEAPTAETTESPAADGSFSTSEAQQAAWEAFVAELDGKWEGKTLNLVTVSDPWIDSMNAQIVKFEALTGAKINVSPFGYTAAYSKEMLVGSEQSAAEDLFVYDIPWIGALSDHLLPLDDYLASGSSDFIQYDDFYKVMQDATTWEGQKLGLPFAPYFILFTYNTELFEKAGISNPPANYEEFAKAAEALTGNGTFGVAMNNQSPTAVGQAYFEYIYNFGGKPFASLYPGSEDPYADMTPQFTSEESLAVVKMFKDLFPYEPEGALNMAWNERFSIFATGRAAMMSPWITDIAPLSDAEKSVVTDKYATAPLPVADGVELNTPVGGYSMGINKYSENQDLAWDFLAWFTSPQIAYEFAKSGGFPNRYSVLNDVALTSTFPYYPTLQQVVDTSFSAFRPQIPEAFEVIDTLGTYIGEYLSDKQTLEEAMDGANQAIGELLKSKGYNVTE